MARASLRGMGIAVPALLLMAQVGCEAEGGAQLTLRGALFDASPGVVLADPAGTAAHRLSGGALVAHALADASAYAAEEGGDFASLAVAEAAFSDTDPGAFTLTGEAIVEGASLTLVASAPGRAPTAFIGQLPMVSDRYDWFRFFDGALFSEPEEALAERVRSLVGDASPAVPDAAEDGSGCLVFGQLVSDPALGVDGGVSPIEGGRIGVSPVRGGGPGEALPATYLDEDGAVDLDLDATSPYGAFFVAGVPAGVVEIAAESPGGAALSPPQRSLCVEDGMIWLSPFYLPGTAP